jgi:recombination protein RecA
MAPRKSKPKLENQELETNSYFKPQAPLEFVSTGCTIFDCALGGNGWPLGRIINLVGDKSTSKSSLATEAVINFLLQYPDGLAFYRETEAAFLLSYSEGMGLPLDKVDFGDPEKPVTTVEEFARDLGAFVGRCLAKKVPGIYVLDSLDALSDEAEMGRDIGEGSYGTKKAAKLSELFRTCTRKLEQANVLLFVVSQVRENINAMFGEKYRRSGGKALDFYSTGIAWLSHLKTLKRTIKKVERPYGIMVGVKIKKNKVAMPHRECSFPFLFGYGIDDLTASLDWLKSIGRLEGSGLENIDVNKITDEDYKLFQQRAATLVKEIWDDIEETFKPVRRKYD